MINECTNATIEGSALDDSRYLSINALTKKLVFCELIGNAFYRKGL